MFTCANSPGADINVFCNPSRSSDDTPEVEVKPAKADEEDCEIVYPVPCRDSDLVGFWLSNRVPDAIYSQTRLLAASLSSRIFVGRNLHWRHFTFFGHRGAVVQR
jgi:hypothetical protein